MPDAPVIADTSPLLYLHQAGYLDILKQLYGSVIVPPAVQAELEAGRAKGFDVPDLTTLDWIHVHPPAAAALVPAVTDLGAGEAEAIALGLEMPDSLLIIDDQLARRIADLYKLRYTGTLGVLVKAKQSGLIPSVSAIIAALREKGMWISDAVENQILRLSGEHTQER